MKYTILAILSFTLSASAGAQDACPEFANSVNAITKSGKGVELGLEEASAKQQKKGLYRGWDSTIRLKNANAKIAFKSAPSFAFRPVNEKVHPRQQIKLYAFDTKKQYRELAVGGMNNWGGTKEKDSQDSSIKLEFKKISPGCYKVTPAVELPPGQYAFSLGDAPDVQGTNAGWAASSQGQVWFGFSVK